MKKMLVVAMSLLSTSLFASNGIGFRSHERSADRIDFNCKILEEVEEGRMEVVKEGVMIAGFYSKPLLAVHTSHRGDKLNVDISATTYSKDKNYGVLVELSVINIKSKGRAPTVLARYPVDVERFEVTFDSAFSGGIRKALVFKGVCERI